MILLKFKMLSVMNIVESFENETSTVPTPTEYGILLKDTLSYESKDIVLIVNTIKNWLQIFSWIAYWRYKSFSRHRKKYT